MRHIFYRTITALITLFSYGLYAVNLTTPYLDFRSQGLNLAREFAGWQQHWNNPKIEEWHGSFFVAPSYTHSIQADNITSLIFGPDLQNSVNCCDQFVKISGSQVPKRNNHDWLADYFGLPTDFESKISVNPQIQNFILDLDLFLAINWNCHNLFVQIHAPYVYTKWQLNFCEEIINPGENNYTSLYMTPYQVPREKLLHSAAEFFAGCVPDLGDAVTFYPLCNSNINPPCASETAHHIADLQVNIGTYVLNDEEYHAAVGLRIVAPTGTRPNGEYVFEPIVGNGHHWELGAYGNVYVLIWEDEAATRKLTGSALAYVTYMFKSTQTRSFDLFDKPNSRYMLTQRLGAMREQPQLTGDANAGVEFQGELAPLANISQGNVFVGSTYQADSVFAITYSNGLIEWDFGYSYWYRGCENVRFKDRCKPEGMNGSSWALKGDAYVYGFVNDYPDHELTTVRLAATERNATIRSGTNNYPYGVDGKSSFQNAGIDSRVEAFASFDGVGMVEATAINDKQIFTSRSPFFLTVDNVDLTGSAGSSNKLFTHVRYTWDYNESYNFFLGAGAEIEIGHSTSIEPSKKNCPATCIIRDCLESSLSQWGVWIKGGFSFE